MEIGIEKIFRSKNVCKVAGTHDLLGRFLKVGSRVLSKPVSELYNFCYQIREFSQLL